MILIPTFQVARVRISDRAGGARRIILAACGGLALMASSMCATAPPLTSLPEEYLGRWYYMGSSGGISGAGTGDAGTGYVVIHADNTLTRHEEDGTLVGTAEFTVHRGPTIFSSEDQWILNLAGAEAEVIAVSEDGQTMSLSENVYDGFGRTYARAR